MGKFDYFLFAVFPYIAIAICISGTIYRFMANRFSWSAQSSQFLENKTLFYGVVPWHYGIVLILVGHIFALFIPQTFLAWNGSPVRLYALEITGLALAILSAVGLAILLFRRFTDTRVKVVSSGWDYLIILVLLVQVVLGIITAIQMRWGSYWLAGPLSSWAWSIVLFNPKPEFVANFSWTSHLALKLHVVNALIFITLIPFSRMVHFFALVGPFKYLFGRPYQLVRWYKHRKEPTATDTDLYHRQEYHGSI